MESVAWPVPMVLVVSEGRWDAAADEEYRGDWGEKTGRGQMEAAGGKWGSPPPTTAQCSAVHRRPVSGERSARPSASMCIHDPLDRSP